jgi:SAM-dependent methyltransferase
MNPVFGSLEWFEGKFSGAGGRGDGWGHRWRASQKIRHRLSADLVSGVLSAGKGLKVLDIGCGLCEFTVLLHRINPDNVIYGCDISKKAIASDKAIYPDFNFMETSLPNLEYDSGCFDLVAALEVVSYFDGAGRLKSFDEIRRIVKPGGYLLYSDGVNRGKEGFVEAEMLAALRDRFEVVEVSYNHAKLYSLFERPLYKVYKVLVNVASREGLFPAIFKTLSYPLRELIVLILGAEWVAEILRWLTKSFLWEAGKTHVIVLARKNG